MPEVVGVILELFALSAENYVVFLSQVWRGWASFGDMRVFYSNTAEIWHLAFAYQKMTH